jgi:hypothetical protein
MSIYRSEWPSTECPRIRFTEVVKGLTVIIFTAIKVMFYLQHMAKRSSYFYKLLCYWF